jgi:hypothetical protein
LAQGAAYHLSRGADIVVQVHYHRDGRLETDRSSIGLHFAKKPTSRRIQELTLSGRIHAIPPGATRYRVTASMWVDRPCALHALRPHLHLVGRDVHVAMTPPGHESTRLLSIRDWDHQWEGAYRLAKPVAVPAGTRFDLEAVYDNSTANLANPYNPPRTILFGQELTDEMCRVYLEVAGPAHRTIHLLTQPSAATLRR